MSNNASTSFMTILFAIDFLENTQKTNYNIAKVSNNKVPNNSIINKYTNNRKTHSINTMNRANHFIGQPQWRGYSH
jgi:hypothetical protein